MNIFLKCMLSILVMTSLMNLTGCAGMNSQFDCNVGSDGMCASMDQINQIADAGALNGDGSETQPVYFHYPTPAGYPTENIEGQPLRTTDRTQIIWIAPYVDKQDNLHFPSRVATVVKKGSWRDIADNFIHRLFS